MVIDWDDVRRYRQVTIYPNPDWGDEAYDEMRLKDDGEWVKYNDVKILEEVVRELMVREKKYKKLIKELESTCEWRKNDEHK